jgi:hypothetical protein
MSNQIFTLLDKKVFGSHVGFNTSLVREKVGIVLIFPSNRARMTQCQSLRVLTLDFDIHLNFELWHLAFSRHTEMPKSFS